MSVLPFLATLVLAAQVSWFWSDEQATRQYSIDHVAKPYSASLRIVERDQFVDTSKRGKMVLSASTHQFSVFSIKDGKLYLAEFGYNSTGCAVESFELKTKKSVWKIWLKGLGPIAHSKYSNRVLMRFEGKTLVIYGNESAGQYREVLDPKSGKMLDNATFPH